MDEPRNLDVRLLRVFASVYLHHSVSAAARELDMSQPGLSTALMRLRKQLQQASKQVYTSKQQQQQSSSSSSTSGSGGWVITLGAYTHLGMF